MFKDVEDEEDIERIDLAALKKLDQYRNPLTQNEEESITKEEEKYVL